MDARTRTDANTIWEYMRLKHEPEGADCMLILGSRDDRVAMHAAGVSRIYDYPAVMITGGISHTQDLLATGWGEQSEALHFAEVYKRHQGRGEPILEQHATNTGQNAIFTYELLVTLDQTPKSILLVTKPYMERRALVTFEAQYPDKETVIRVCSQNVMLEEYCNKEQPFELVINIMVGDLQRIIEYPKRGLQTPQVIPEYVMQAYEYLLSKGYKLGTIK